VFLNGWINAPVNGRMNECMHVKAVLRIAYSDQKNVFKNFITFRMWKMVGGWMNNGWVISIL
jgi:hypothetical protein